MTRHFLRDDDLSPAEQMQLLALAANMKQDRLGYRPYEGQKAVVLIFDKPSTRTRVSFSVGVLELAGCPIILDSQTTQMSRGESIQDTVRTLDRHVSAIVWRTFEQQALVEMAATSRVPVVNALTDDFHPCQLLADLLTITERKGRLSGQTIAFFGDIANNMANSYVLACATAGMHVRLASPLSIAPDPAVIERGRQIAKATGGSVEVFDDAKHAAYNADVLATDTWASMGQAPVTSETRRQYQPFQINDTLLRAAAPDAIVLHCLPAYRGKEITGDVMDGPQSAIWDEAENRLHVQKALLTLLSQWS